MALLSDNSTKTNFIFYSTRILVRSLQAIFALVACGLYGRHLEFSDVYNRTPSSQWIFAEFVAGVSFVSVFLYFTPCVTSCRLFPLDIILFILWLALFATFAKLFLTTGSEVTEQLQFLHDETKVSHLGINVSSMTTAVWIDLSNAFLWLLTAVNNTWKYDKMRKERKFRSTAAQWPLERLSP